MAKIYRRRHKLGGYGGLGAPFPAKPKWMRCSTYNHLLANDASEMKMFLGLEVSWVRNLANRLSLLR